MSVPATAIRRGFAAKPRGTPLELAIARLTAGHGATRLPPALQTIEIRGIPSRGLRKGHRAFVKTVLPRIKYNNSQLEVRTEWRVIADRKGKGKKETKKETNSDKATASETTSQGPSSLRGPDPIILLHFDGLPSQQLTMKDSTVTEITRDMLSLIHSTTKTSFGEEVDAAEGAPGEEGAVQAVADVHSSRTSAADEGRTTPVSTSSTPASR